MKHTPKEKGIALIALFFIIVILVILGIGIFSQSLNESILARRHRDRVKAHFIARAGLAQVTMDIYDEFSNNVWNPSTGIASFNWFVNTLPNRDDLFASRVSFDTIVADEDIGMFTVQLPTTQRANENAPGIRLTSDGAEVRLIAIGEIPVTYLGGRGTVKEIISAEITYELGPSPVFDYAYFINNYGWLWGGGITVNGDVRSNGNFSFNGNPEINGDVYASLNPDLGAAGDITGNSRNLDISHYTSQAPDEARPMNPTDPTDPEGTAYNGGYDGTSTYHPQQEVLDMPFLGDLQSYRDLAALEDGSIKQVNAGSGQLETLVDNVYSGNGPDGTAGTADDGTLILIGTETRPIIVDGPVVIDNDVIIRGVVGGQGTIYSGRNTHIIGDITYKNGPSWTKPDANPEVTAAANMQKDFLGLACKGNIIVGDYTRNDWQRNVARYLQPPFTQGYAVDATDAPLGYDSNGNPADGYWFNGNYTSLDGGQKSDGTNRKFYESSIPDAIIQSISASSNQIRQVDAVAYNNHAWAGKVGNFDINGSIICRDEAIVYSGNIFMNYDIRAYGDGMEYLNIYLPRALAFPTTKLLSKLKR